jgi:hypothetical protein
MFFQLASENRWQMVKMRTDDADLSVQSEIRPKLASAESQKNVIQKTVKSNGKLRNNTGFE